MHPLQELSAAAWLDPNTNQTALLCLNLKPTALVEFYAVTVIVDQQASRNTTCNSTESPHTSVTGTNVNGVMLIILTALKYIRTLHITKRYVQPQTQQKDREPGNLPEKAPSRVCARVMPKREGKKLLKVVHF